MKTKYISRKFLVAVVGLIVSIVAIVYGNTLVALGGLALAGCFVIGEAIVDAKASIKRSTSITETRNVVNGKEEKDAT